ncbi:Agmatine deiminase (EC 3.5.3.12) [Spiroplasma endosymbiont of Danaus chrysippus]|nr:agmatine deiminase family protein [Spiroplasma endosymbiont of Danaus chrysippus]CAB1055101.1 Agmatine deiminase (EC 3.5.3.12) [Spiroplasma endosymbiont of Danaus chrysippus]
MLKKLFMEIKQRKTKKKINKIKENLVFIERINLLIEKIENFKIKFIEITIYAQDIDLTSYYLSQHNLENNSNKYYFKTKNEAIILLKKYKKIYEQRITKTKEKYGKSIVLEGGSIHQDGEGTIYTTEECLLNPNRNPDLTKEEIEEHLKQYLNAQKIIWIPRGVYNDETSGHVDNLLHIITPGHVVLTWTDDKNDPQYERSLEALTFLKNSTDAKGRKIKVTKLHQSAPLFITKSEAENREKSPRFANRTEGFRMPASYVNFYITNKTIIIATCYLLLSPFY